MGQSGTQHSLENFILKHPVLKSRYEVYLKEHKDFNSSGFTSWLLLFDFFLKEENKVQKQINFKPFFIKKSLYNISLLYNRIKNDSFFSSIPWWNKITDYVYLGALPLKKHLKALKKVGISSVVSMVEAFEQEDSCVGKPIRKDLWQKNSVQNKRFETPDFQPISLKTLYEGASFLKESVEENKKTYVHCKAGRGRSAATIMAYLLLFCGFSYEKAVQLIKSKRPHIDLENKKNNIEVLNSLYHIFYKGDSNKKYLERLSLIFG